MKRKFKYEFGRQATHHGAMPGDIEHSDTRVFDTYDYMMRNLREWQSDELDDDIPVMSRAGWNH